MSSRGASAKDVLKRRKLLALRGWPDARELDGLAQWPTPALRDEIETEMCVNPKFARDLRVLRDACSDMRIVAVGPRKPMGAVG